jgi:hypothetical protein
LFRFQYLYLLLAGVENFATGVVLLLRRDLWRAVLAVGVIGGGIEVLSELWYLNDYWQPPTVIPLFIVDFLYGFATSALAVCAVPFWSFVVRRRLAYDTNQTEGDNCRFLLFLIPAFAGVMSLMQAFTAIPSIWTASGCFVLGGVFACYFRRDLLMPGIVAGIIMGTVAAVGYGIGLNWLVDGKAFLTQVYLLSGTKWDIRVLGQVPLDEIVWNMARGWCFALMYPFISGRRLVACEQQK